MIFLESSQISQENAKKELLVRFYSALDTLCCIVTIVKRIDR